MNNYTFQLNFCPQRYKKSANLPNYNDENVDFSVIFAVFIVENHGIDVDMPPKWQFSYLF